MCITEHQFWTSNHLTLIVCFDGGGLNPRPWPGSHGNSHVKPPKTIIVLEWLTFLALDLHYTLPHMFHPIIVGVFGWTGFMQPTTWGTYKLALGGNTNQLASVSASIQSIHLQKKAPNSHNAHSRLHKRNLRGNYSVCSSCSPTSAN